MDKLEDILNAKFCVYTYTTLDNENGCVITHSDLVQLFDENVLFEMDNVKMTLFSIKDLIENGFVKAGSTDTMDTLNIKYPVLKNDDQTNGPSIKGRFFHGSRTKLISQKLGIDFKLDPASDLESNDQSDDESDDRLEDKIHRNEDDKSIDLNDEE